MIYISNLWGTGLTNFNFYNLSNIYLLNNVFASKLCFEYLKNKNLKDIFELRKMTSIFNSEGLRLFGNIVVFGNKFSKLCNVF